MLNPVPVFDDVKAKIEEIVAPLLVIESELPEDIEVPVQNGKPVPYIAIYTGGPIRSSRDHHITGVRNDTTILFWTIVAVAARADIANYYKGKIIQELSGYRPVDSGEMVAVGGNTPSRASNEIRPTQYLAETQFTVRSNLGWNE